MGSYTDAAPSTTSRERCVGCGQPAERGAWCLDCRRDSDSDGEHSLHTVTHWESGAYFGWSPDGLKDWIGKVHSCAQALERKRA